MENEKETFKIAPKRQYYVPQRSSGSECSTHPTSVVHYHCAAECKDFHPSWEEAARCNQLYIHASIAESLAQIAADHGRFFDNIDSAVEGIKTYTASPEFEKLVKSMPTKDQVS